MEIFSEILFLALMGFLHLRRADADYHRDRFVLTMNDGYTYNANIDVTCHVPQWLKPDRVNEPPPEYMQFYMRSTIIQYKAFIFEKPTALTHNPLNHTPRSISIYLKLSFLKTNYIIDRTFEEYTPENHARWFPSSSKPARGYIYLTVPGGHKYRAPLPRPTSKKDLNRNSNLPPGISGPKSPEASPPHPHHGASSSSVTSTS